MFVAVLGLLYVPLVVDAMLRGRPVLDLFEGLRIYGDLWSHNDSVFAVVREACIWCMREFELSSFADRVARALIALMGLGLLGMTCGARRR